MTETWKALVYNKDIDRDGVMQVYKEWSNTYDSDLDTLGSGLCTNVGAWTASLVPEADRAEARVMDLAAGTGRVGVQLHKLGFRNMEAVDGSQEMLDRLDSLQLYRRSICAFLGNGARDERRTPGVDDNSYDVVTLAGGFASGHLPLDAFREAIRILKPGGVFVHGMTEHYIHFVDALSDLEGYMERLEADEGLWTRVRREVIKEGGANKNDGLFHAYRKN